MTKKIILAVVLVLVLASVVLAFNPKGFSRNQLENNEKYINTSLTSFGIDALNVENIIWQRLDGYSFADAFFDDRYVWWFTVQGEEMSFCVSCPKTNDYAYVALVDDFSADSIGYKIVINGQIDVLIGENMTFSEMFSAVEQALRQVAPNGYQDGWTFLTLKMLLESLQIHY